jgi:hypothetical protein
VSHRVKRPTPQPEMAATGAICLQFGISQDFLKKNRQSGQLRQGIHFIHIPGSTKILWRVGLLRDWLANGGDSPAHQRAIERYLKSLPSHPDYKPTAA